MTVGPFPADLGALSDKELKALVRDLESVEHDVSFRRRILHGQIDILRAELAARLARAAADEAQA